MIAYLKGLLATKKQESAIIDINGVGYEVEISTQTYQQLPKEETEVKLLVYHHITDNDQRLFGFATADEKELFELLITVKGVGPKLGLTILSGLPASQIISSLAQSDTDALKQITGIGKKTAERMILELKDKIADLSMGLPETTTDGAGAISGNLKQEAVSALESLGYKKRDAEKAVTAAANNNGSFDDLQQLVKASLAMLNR
ncbi:Holliday junction branch migration protein RuvA [Aliifodinibius sp. S!AR15-10]|uniref:Holliday junction branch migration protein RuvA n=1 Tax=Aliifodinibius sp. S!AR15-10 TaxID=2950437 RepID=UPI0028546CB6|nr:Holliday junction branch migration protein RuvA [Aliifodinibius sp. S!AR15-10]MDR8394316.1 Holliday junction branch migration protein RuvA [Aliifodinibius sp. S!AR15-10]